MPRNREPHVFGLDHDYSAAGSFEVEVQLRKGQEVKQDLQAILDGVSNGQLVEREVEVEVTLSDNLGLFIIPRFPIDRFGVQDNSLYEATIEPFIIKGVRVDFETEDDELSLVMTGELDESDAQEWLYKFDPLAGHEIIAIAKNGDYRTGGLRVSSGDDLPKLKLEIY